MIDLHTHTTASDGTTSPTELIAEASSAGLAVLSITDHDTFDGWEAARPLAKAVELHLVPGVELSTTLDADARALLPGFRADVHLLAYFPVAGPPASFRQWVSSLLESRWERNRTLIRRLADKGLPVDEAMLRAFGGPVAGRVHLARMLKDMGQVKSINEAFLSYFGESAVDYVPRNCPPLSETIARVREAGGTPSLAHPIRFWGERREEGERLCAWAAERGLLALEVWHSEQTRAYSGWLAELAERHQLGRTGGSDFHGLNKPGIFLGVGRGSVPLVPSGEWQWSGEALGERLLPADHALDN
ncbi:MAG: PHP domain-containing protein [Bryobacterales bacterium]|nr:PHP domain-containing protein [Bryobacterales bacterium]